MKLKGRRQSSNIDEADPSVYLESRTRMPWTYNRPVPELPGTISLEEVRSNQQLLKRPRKFNKGGMVKGRDYGKKC